MNGNPVTGTEGSIPPATSFDEDQIEIVEVISRAGLTPDHDNLHQLWDALMALFAQRYITTPITKTVHGAGADFPNLIEAMKWVAQYIITPTGLVTFLCATGQWTYTQTVEITHPNAARIIISAASVPSQSVPQNFMSVAFNPSVQGPPGQRDTDGNVQIGQLRNIWKTELQFQAGVTGFRIFTPGVTFRYLLLTGSNSQAASVGGDPGGCGICAFNTTIIDQMAFWQWGFAGAYVVNASLLSFTSNSNVFSYCKNSGIWSYGGLIQFPSNQNVITTSHGTAGWTCFGTEVYAGIMDVRGCATARILPGGGASNNGAVQVEQGTQFMASSGSGFSSLVSLNNHIGVTVPDASSAQFSGSQVINNGTWQIWMNNGVCWAESANVQQLAGTVYPNGGVAILQNGAQLSLLGASIGGSVVPAPNTYGTADNSYVRR